MNFETFRKTKTKRSKTIPPTLKNNTLTKRSNICWTTQTLKSQWIGFYENWSRKSILKK